MTAELERRQFGPSLPVHWWDQPLVRAGADRAFETLIAATERTLWPEATVEVVDAGQFPHLELPPSIWLPGSGSGS